MRSKVGIFEVLLVAAVYFLTARLGQTLAIPPGNVTPVWIPSGIILTWALVRGPGIWPGVFLGALLGNAWAYFEPGGPSEIMQAAIAGGANGIGDVIASAVCAQLLHRYSKPFEVFKSVSAVFWFLLIGVAGGPFASALFGVTGLWAAGLVETPAYGYVFATWFTGDAIGVLTIAPVLIAIFQKEPLFDNHRSRLEIGSNFILTAVAVYVAFWSGVTGLAESFALFAFPILLVWSAARLSGLFNTSIVLLIAAGVIVPTALGIGPFTTAEINDALINTQLMLGAAGIIVLLLHASREQVRRYIRSLERAKAELDDRVEERTKQLETAKREAERLASTDALTGLSNRRSFFQRAGEEINRFKHTGAPTSVIMLDIDHFKRINDTHGHGDGDEVLKDLASTISQLIRSYDLFARIGGEEFAVLLAGSDQTAAVEVAEKLAGVIRTRRVTDKAISYTASFGVSEMHLQDISISDVLKRADVALYYAKQHGRDQVAAYSEHFGKTEKPADRRECRNRPEVVK